MGRDGKPYYFDMEAKAEKQYSANGSKYHGLIHCIGEELLEDYLKAKQELEDTVMLKLANEQRLAFGRGLIEQLKAEVAKASTVTAQENGLNE
jgi:hypothetical protein